MTTPPDPTETPSAVPAASGPPPVVPDHELLRLIGRGSSGQVWLARNTLGTCRAVKIVPERQSRQGTSASEFNGILKFEPVSRLHDGLVDILQVGRNEAAGYFYYVMELADDVVCGQNIVPETYLPRTLGEDRARLKRLPVAECVRLGAAIASALGFLHQHGLIHRDIKPHNIIFVNGAPKLADIGLVTEAAGIQSQTGTQGFIPPEGSGTTRADIYSLGKVLYEISTGMDRNDYPVLPELPGNAAEDEALLLLNGIILKACRAKPWERYQTAEEMMLALLNFQFNRDHLRRKRNEQVVTQVARIVGPIIAAGIIIAMLWRIIWLLKHPH
ncbi:MAG: serine/threonine-protein kinase [Verrucomicrobiia bacterium]|jgi:serine/threonine protein kinase